MLSKGIKYHDEDLEKYDSDFDIEDKDEIADENEDD